MTISNVRASKGGAKEDLMSSTAPQEAHQPSRAVSVLEQFREEAGRIERGRDALGRMIGVKKLSFWDVNKLTALAGENASNAAFLNQYMMTASIVEIDGDAIAMPQTKREMDALMQRADFPGVVKATELVSTRYTTFTAEEADAAVKP